MFFLTIDLLASQLFFQYPSIFRTTSLRRIYNEVSFFKCNAGQTAFEHKLFICTQQTKGSKINVSRLKRLAVFNVGRVHRKAHNRLCDVFAWTCFYRLLYFFDLFFCQAVSNRNSIATSLINRFYNQFIYVFKNIFQFITQTKLHSLNLQMSKNTFIIGSIMNI